MKSSLKIIELCLLMMCIIFNCGASLKSLKQPRNQLMPLGGVDETNISLKQLIHVKGDPVSFQRVRETTFIEVPAVIHTNASLIRKHWDLLADHDNSSKEIILFQRSVKVGGCKIRYRDDTQGCVFCYRNSKCPSGWTYHTWRSCGFGGCQSVCYQRYDCPTPAPTTLSPTPSPTTPSPTTQSPTPAPTPSPTWSPSHAPTFAPFSVPREVDSRTPFAGFTSEVYIINQFTGTVIEQNILEAVSKKCSRVINDTQGCVFCFRTSKCPSGSEYRTWEHCGVGGCQSVCTQHYDCPDPFEILYMDYISSSFDNSGNKIPHHSQLWHFNEKNNRIITSRNNWVIQTKGNKVVAGPDTSSSASDLSYDRDKRTIRIGDKFLCINDNILAVCENSDSARSRWIFKTPVEAFPHDFGAIEKYYIANKKTDLVVEMAHTREGYPLTTWIPDGSSGQLWYSDSHGRIRNDDYIMEAVDVVAIKYIIPDVPIGKKFSVSISNHTDAQLTMTPQLWHFRGTTDYLVLSVNAESNGLVSTTRKQDHPDDWIGHDKQQWDLIGGQLVNGWNDKKLVVDNEWSHGNVSLPLAVGEQCRLKDDTTDEFYLVPEAMIISWIDLLVMKKFDVSYVREEVLFYQKIAAFHISTIIGLSPEELVTRANYFEGFITEGVTELRKKTEDARIGDLVATHADLVSSILKVLGLAALGPNWGAGITVYLMGQALSLSASAVRKINKVYHNERSIAEDHVETILYEIQASVVSGMNALASFLDDYNAAMKRLKTYNESPEGQEELHAMQEYTNAIAVEIGYIDAESFRSEVSVFGTPAWNWIKSQLDKSGRYSEKLDSVKNTASEIMSGFDIGYFLGSTLMLGTAQALGNEISSTEALKIVSMGGSQKFGLLWNGYWVFANGVSFLQQAIDLHKNKKLGEEMLHGAATIRKGTVEMYQYLSELNGDIEDLKDLSAIVSQSEMFFTNNELNDKWRTLTNLGYGVIDSFVYGKLYDVNWYSGCTSIPCAELD